ncbi:MULTISPECIES: hypothetical protein [Bacillus]|uniref:hypothetical protein n=1 Tax=Bacillus TaxID=1386 RepID=UPI00300FAA97
MNKVKNLVIYTNKYFKDDEKALFDVDTETVLLTGDYYHDKIDFKIEGYLLALNINKDDVPTEEIDNSHKYFEKFNFMED